MVQKQLDSQRNYKNSQILQEKKRKIELLEKEYNRQRNLDPKLVESLAKAKAKGYESWQEAKSKSDFDIFLPFFKDLIIFLLSQFLIIIL